ncbi:UNVERIFIED_CONTAM: hypothetical protein GTU68_031866 [Idotea baltica]|nr:hypothetical protein [Idotea baltica]
MAAALETASGGTLRGEIVPFTTTGDKLTTERLINSGGKGLFTRELDDALDAGKVDITVHSLKDVPTALPAGQIALAYPEREDPREGFLSAVAIHPADMPEGAKLGTASLRREAQTLALRPDLEIVTFRGNVATRMRKLEEGLADATYLAMAGLTRLGIGHLATPISLEDMLPSAGQGIIVVVAREDVSVEVKAALAKVTHEPTEAAATAERAMLTELDGSCRTPIAAHLFDHDEHWHLIGEVLSIDGQQRWRSDGIAPKSASIAELAELGRSVGRDIREAAGGELPAFEDDA